MRKLLWIVLLLPGCDNARVYEKYHDFSGRFWTADEKPEFEFTVPDNSLPYNAYINIRHESAYPYANLYVTYRLLDSAGQELQQKLISGFLFDKKTGKPEGQSGIGDIYDHRLLLLGNYTFPYSGKYTLRFEQFMRTDTLQGVLAVGLRVEKHLKSIGQ